MKRLVFILFFALSIFAKDKADQTMVFLTVKDYFKNQHYSEKPIDAYIAEVQSNYNISRCHIKTKAKLMIKWENRVQYRRISKLR